MSGRVEAPVAGDGQVVVDREDLKLVLSRASAVPVRFSDYGGAVARFRAALAVSTEGEESK